MFQHGPQPFLRSFGSTEMLINNLNTAPEPGQKPAETLSEEWKLYRLGHLKSIYELSNFQIQYLCRTYSSIFQRNAFVKSEIGARDQNMTKLCVTRS